MIFLLFLYLSGIIMSYFYWQYVNLIEFKEYDKRDKKFIIPFLLLSWILFISVHYSYTSYMDNNRK